MKIRIPATTANMGAGFDTFGMALGYYNYISIVETETMQIQIKGEGVHELSGRKDNLVLRSIKRVFDETGKIMPNFKLIMENGIPLSRGMGSSAAAIVGGLYIANAMQGFPLADKNILQLATAIEGHPDNVAPALYGGFVITAFDNNKDIFTVKMQPPRNLKLVVCIPEYKLATKKARDVLPNNVSLQDAVYNVSHASLLVGALANNNLDLLKIALNDKLHQPYRFNLIPGSEQVIKAAMDADALGCVISGSGPTMLAFTKGNERLIGMKMRDAFAEAGLKARYLVVSVDSEGTKLMQEE